MLLKQNSLCAFAKSSWDELQGLLAWARSRSYLQLTGILILVLIFISLLSWLNQFIYTRATFSFLEAIRSSQLNSNAITEDIFGFAIFEFSFTSYLKLFGLLLAALFGSAVIIFFIQYFWLRITKYTSTRIFVAFRHYVGLYTLLVALNAGIAIVNVLSYLVFDTVSSINTFILPIIGLFIFIWLFTVSLHENKRLFDKKTILVMLPAFIIIALVVAASVYLIYVLPDKFVDLSLSYMGL